MKILFTVASYYPVPGGVQMVTQYTAEGLVKLGHKVIVITSTFDRKGNMISEHNGVKLLYTNVYKWRDVIRGDIKGYISLVMKEVETVDVLINVSLQTPTTDLIIPHLCEIKCKKVLYLHDMHDFAWTKMDYSSINRITSKIFYNFTRRIYYGRIHKYLHSYDLVTHLTQFDNSYKYMQKHGIKKNIILGNAALDSMFEPCTEKLNRNYFLNVANYAEHKNQKFILKSYYKSCVDYDMIFVGREPNKYLEELIDLKKELDIKYGEKRVEFKVGIPRAETEILFKNAKALILGSRIEKFPIVVIEAMASMIPFISTNTGCVKYIPGGYVIEDIEDMAYWMKFLFDNEECRCLLGKIGYDYACKYMTIQSKIQILLNNLS